jgi:hypothetical protein
MFKKIQYGYLLKKYKKWGVLKVAVCPSFIWNAGFLKVNTLSSVPGDFCTNPPITFIYVLILNELKSENEVIVD